MNFVRSMVIIDLVVKKNDSTNSFVLLKLYIWIFTEHLVSPTIDLILHR